MDKPYLLYHLLLYNMNRVLYNTTQADILRGITAKDLPAIDSFSGIIKQASILKSDERLRKLFNPPYMIPSIKAQPDRVDLQITSRKIPSYEGLSGLQKQADLLKAEKEVSIIIGANQALKEGLPSLAEDVLGRKLTPQEIVNGRIGQPMNGQALYDKIHNGTARDIVNAINNKATTVDLTVSNVQVVKLLDSIKQQLKHNKSHADVVAVLNSIKSNMNAHGTNADVVNALQEIKRADDVKGSHFDVVNALKEVNKHMTELQKEHAASMGGISLINSQVGTVAADDDYDPDMDDNQTYQNPNYEFDNDENEMIEEINQSLSQMDDDETVEQASAMSVIEPSTEDSIMQFYYDHQNQYDENKKNKNHKIVIEKPSPQIDLAVRNYFLKRYPNNPAKYSKTPTSNLLGIYGREIIAGQQKVSKDGSSSSGQQGHGISLNKIGQHRADMRKDVAFGRYEIDRNALNRNVLSLRFTHNKHPLTNYPRMSISDHLRCGIEAIMSGTYFDINSLDAVEKRFLDTLVKNSKVNFSMPKTFGLTHEKKFKTVKEVGSTKAKYEAKFKILTGEILAGNDSKEIMKELRELCLQMSSSGLLTHDQAREVIDQFC